MKLKNTIIEKDEELVEVFKTFDQQNRGFYDVNEMKQIMALNGENISDQEADQLFKDIDADQDGRISFEDFVQMMMAK